MIRRPRPFRLGTTSFIYPGKILPNVKCLGPIFDEIVQALQGGLPGNALGYVHLAGSGQSWVE